MQLGFYCDPPWSSGKPVDTLTVYRSDRQIIENKISDLKYLFYWMDLTDICRHSIHMQQNTYSPQAHIEYSSGQIIY